MSCVIRHAFIAAGFVLALAGCDPSAAPTTFPDSGQVHGQAEAPRIVVSATDDALRDAIRRHAHDVPVEGRGSVVRVLRDDTTGSPHQKFLLRVADDTTVLVAHNIDIAPRLDGLAAGDTVEFRGRYVWSPKGGTVHWTHRDPRGTHADGWLRWNGRTYD